METTTNLLVDLLSYQAAVHQTTKDKGFYHPDRDKGEMVMLTITELSEAVEAHRKNHRADVDDPALITAVNILKGKILPGTTSLDVSEESKWAHWFPRYVKNTIEDEMADAVIRILDYCACWQKEILFREYRKESTGNFAHDVLRLTHYTMEAYHERTPGKDWGYLMAAIIKFCEWYNIDIISHVGWKARYNSTRPYKHGKAY